MENRKKVFIFRIRMHNCWKQVFGLNFKTKQLENNNNKNERKTTDEQKKRNDEQMENAFNLSLQAIVIDQPSDNKRLKSYTKNAFAIP